MMELRIIDKFRLYDASIYTAVLSGIVAGCMGLDNKEIYYTVIGGLLHNIGMAEMPALLTINNRSEQ